MPSPDTNTASTKGNWLASMLNMPNDSIEKTLVVAVALCLVCSVVVASAAVFLKPVQTANRTLDIKKNLLEVAGISYQPGNINEIFEQVEAHIVNLDTGEYAEDIDPATYDMAEAARNPDLSEPVAAAEDIAKIKRRPKYAPVYMVKEGDQLKRLILPVYGYGLWSTMYAFLALDGDLDTVAALNYYQQAETAGLGGEVANPDWLAKWKGKEVFGDQGKVRIGLVKGAVEAGSPESQYKVDGLAGATLTSRGVTNMMHYWLGENGFGPFLDKLRKERG